jgi:hypothetical protein
MEGQEEISAPPFCRNSRKMISRLKYQHPGTIRQHSGLGKPEPE